MGPVGLTILPGEEHLLEMKLRVDSRSGARISHVVNVETNDPAHRCVKLQAAWTTLDAVKWEPLALRFEEFARTAESVTETITITRADGGPISPQILLVEERSGPDHTWIEISRERMQPAIRELEKGERYELSLTARRPWPNNGRWSGRVRISTGVDEVPEKTIGFYMKTAKRLTLEPDRFSVPMRATEQSEQRVVLHWSPERPAPRLLGASVNARGLLARVETHGGVQMVVLRISPSFRWQEGRWPTVRVLTDEPEFPEFRIFIRRLP